MTIAADIDKSGDRLARRNSLVLALAQAFGGALVSINTTLGGLVGIYLLSTQSPFATLPVTTMVVGTACGTLPAAWLLERIGRRRGFMVGTLASAAGGLVGFFAIHAGSMALFCFGTFLGGFSFAFVNQYRFAAAENASLEFKPKAISTVLAGGILAGVVGPQTVIISKDLFLPVPFAGAYLAAVVLSGMTLLVVSFYRQGPSQEVGHAAAIGRPLMEILTEPKVVVAIVSAMIGYSIMVLVMTAAPLAMIACGFTTADAALGIQWHVIAMFGPSFFTGYLITRFGAWRVTACGLVLLVGAAVTAILGIALMNFYVSLVLLGVGWNFAFIGGTAMLTAAQRPEERARTQAANEFIVFGVVALTSLFSGMMFHWVGWAALNWAVLPMVAVALFLLIGSVVMERRRHRLA